MNKNKVSSFLDACFNAKSNSKKHKFIRKALKQAGVNVALAYPYLRFNKLLDNLVYDKDKTYIEGFNHLLLDLKTNKDTAILFPAEQPHSIDTQATSIDGRGNGDYDYYLQRVLDKARKDLLGS